MLFKIKHVPLQYQSLITCVMKTTYSLQFLFLIILTALTSCLDNDVYDPNNKKDNGNTTDLVIPPGFTWSMTTDVAVNVSTDNKSDHTFTILVYPQGATSETLPLIAGTSRNGAPFRGEITVPAGDTIVSIVKTLKYNDGDKLRMECVAPIVNGKVTVDLGNMKASAATRASRATTRGMEEDMKKWDEMMELTDKINKLEDGVLYKISEDNTRILDSNNNKIKLNNAKIYVAGILEIANDVDLNNTNGGGKIIILGKGVKSDKGGLLKSDGNVTIKNGLEIENYGNINIAGTLTIRDNSEVETQGCVYANHIELSAQGQGGKLEIEEGGYVETESMDMEKSEIELEKNAYLHIQGTLTIKGKDNEIEGDTPRSSVVEVGKIEKENGGKGSLNVEDCYIVSNEERPDFVHLKKHDDLAMWGDRNAAASYGVKTESPNCGNFSPEENGSGGSTDPEEITTSHGTQTYAFEDLWPNYGDYDMNDLVLETYPKIHSSHGIITKIVIDYKITAIGASKNIAAGVQWDNVKPEAISSIEYSTPNNFTKELFQRRSNGTEQKQQYAVIPLFDNAHKFSGANEYAITGTHANSHFDAKEFTVTINLAPNGPTLKDVKLDDWNYFIICGDATSGKRMEIHMRDSKPTDLFDASLIGGKVASPDAPFKTTDNFCWVMRIPSTFNFPLEGNDMRQSYEEFEKWITDPSYKWYENGIDGKIKY